MKPLNAFEFAAALMARRGLVLTAGDGAKIFCEPDGSAELRGALVLGGKQPEPPK